MKRFGVQIAALVTLVAPWTADAQCPLPTPVAFDEATVVPIGDASACTGAIGDSGAAVSRTIPVNGLPTFLTDINVRLNIAHTCPGDVQATLTSPQGTIVSLVTNLGGPNGASTFCFGSNPVLAGTTFDDDADPAGSVPYAFNNSLATDIDPAFNAVVPFLVPEEALAAFYGENPIGNWILRVVDTCAGDSGSLQSWGLDIAALPVTPTEASQTFSLAGPEPIPDGGVLISNLDVAGAGTFLTDVEVATAISHGAVQNTQFALRSPAGTVVTLSTDNGGGINTFNPSVWDDDADAGGSVPHLIIGGNGGVASDDPYTLANVPTLVPEEAMGAFYGEDPTGTWNLVIADTEVGTMGSLQDWSLVLTTGACPAPTPTPTGTLTPTPTLTPSPTVTPGGPTVTPVGPTPTPTPTLAPKICNGLPATIVGTTGNDLIIGTGSDDVIHGKGGNDEIKGKDGQDLICGGSGNDILRGGQGDDLIKGGSGNDFIKGGGGRDVLLGNKNDDTLNGGDADDTCIDDEGNNTFIKCETVND